MALLRPVRAALIGVMLLGGLTACGVPLQSAAEPLPANVIPAPLPVPTPSPSPEASSSPSPSPTPEPTVSRLRLWFVQDGGLAAAESTLPVGSGPDVVIQSLAIGPSADQTAQGLRTVARDPLTGSPSSPWPPRCPPRLPRHRACRPSRQPERPSSSRACRRTQ